MLYINLYQWKLSLKEKDKSINLYSKQMQNFMKFVYVYDCSNG